MNISKFKASVRRVGSYTLPGASNEEANVKIGASLRGNTILKGLSFEEEVKYLPSIINVSPKDPAWFEETKNYWSNISVPVPHDNMSNPDLPGRDLSFSINFEDEKFKKAFEASVDLKEKAKIAENGTVVEGVDNYVLFKYCLEYSRVAASFALVRKSAKILFYLYSPTTEKSIVKINFEKRMKARNKFIEIINDDTLVDAMLLIYGQDLALFKETSDKHIALEAKIEKNPDLFLKEIGDVNLKYKSFIKKAVNARVIHNPSNTDSYYYGDNNEINLGNTITDAILYLKNDANAEIKQAIQSRLKTI